MGSLTSLLCHPPCSTWSRAVWANRLGPKPVRSREFPFGFPWLKAELKEKADLGTTLVMRCIEALELAPGETVCLWEHPEDLGRARNGTPASMWQLEALRKVAKKRGMDTIAFHQCTYGADYPKPTRFLSDARGLLQLGFGGWPTFNKDLYYLGPLPRSCGHSHQPLIGAEDGGGLQDSAYSGLPSRNESDDRLIAVQPLAPKPAHDACRRGRGSIATWVREDWQWGRGGPVQNKDGYRRRPSVGAGKGSGEGERSSFILHERARTEALP